jgi:8-oxo-dGTP pyrophosphatase MutT (NUDIX family)
MTPSSDATPLAAWLDRPAENRRLSLADLMAGVRHHRRVVRGPVVTRSRDAGVLIPVFGDDQDLRIVLIERAHDIGSHRGDIAFPGGACNPGERASAAALREAEEEVGIRPAGVTVAASLSTRPIVSGFVMWPYIGVLPSAPRLDRFSPEVARTLVVSAAELLADGHWWQEPWPSGGGGGVLDYFAVPGGVAWGTTGELLREVLQLCIAGRARRTGPDEG